ncbi:helix-turn-helix domain-containing protein [Amylibacter sp.]|nr:helix-turn-helix domain-containing protein [Amylibacter sp.]
MKIRLAGINAPELDRPYGVKSKYENRTRKTTIDRDEVKRLKADGLSTYKIADAMKISRMSVHRILNQSA